MMTKATSLLFFIGGIKNNIPNTTMTEFIMRIPFLRGILSTLASELSYRYVGKDRRRIQLSQSISCWLHSHSQSSPEQS